MREIPIKQKLWEKTVRLSRKHIGIRVLAVAWMAVYLFFRHLSRGWIKRPHSGGARRWIALAVVMSLVIVNPAFSGAESVAAAKEEGSSADGSGSGLHIEGEPEQEAQADYQLSAEITAQPDAVSQDGDTEQTRYAITLTNDGDMDVPLSEIALLNNGKAVVTLGGITMDSGEGNKGYRLYSRNAFENNVAAVEADPDQESGDEMSASELPERLAVGERLTFYVDLPIGQLAGTDQNVLCVSTGSVGDVVELPLTLLADSVDGSNAENPVSEDTSAGNDVGNGGDSSGSAESTGEAGGEATGGETGGETTGEGTTGGEATDGETGGETTGGETPAEGTGDTPEGETPPEGTEEPKDEETPAEGSGETPEGEEPAEETPADGNAGETEGAPTEEAPGEEDALPEGEPPAEGDAAADGFAEEEAAGEEPIEEAETERPLSMPILLDCDRPGGLFLGGAYFTGAQNVYQFRIDNPAELNIICRYNNTEETLTNADGFYTWYVPQVFDALMEIGYVSEIGEFVSLFSEHVVTDQAAPQVSYQCSPDNSKILLISLEETQIVNSGINNYQITVDGAQTIPETEQVMETQTFGKADGVVSRLELGVHMDFGWHDVGVVATDHMGNTATVEFEIEIKPQDVISVVLPTTFDIALRPWDLSEQVSSDDILICNKSEFAVDVQVSSVEVDVDKSIPEGEVVKAVLPADDEAYEVQEYAGDAKSCNINMQLMTADQDIQLFETPEGMTDHVTSFILGAGREETDLQQLREIEHADGVKSDDYAIVNFRGMLEAGSESWWQDGDLKIKVVFSFGKHSQDGENHGGEWSVCGSADVIAD